MLFLWWKTVELISFILKVWPLLFSNSHIITKQNKAEFDSGSRFLLISDLPKLWLDSCLSSLQIYELYPQLFPQCGFDFNNSKIQSLSASFVIDLIFHRRISWFIAEILTLSSKSFLFLRVSFTNAPTKKRKQIVDFFTTAYSITQGKLRSTEKWLCLVFFSFLSPFFSSPHFKLYLYLPLFLMLLSPSSCQKSSTVVLEIKWQISGKHHRALFSVKNQI